MRHDSPHARLERLRRLSILAERRLQACQRRWLDERRRLESLTVQRRELLRFAQEYQRSVGETEITLPTLLSGRRAFVSGLTREGARLGDEIERQQERVETSREALSRPATERLAIERAEARQQAACRVDAVRVEQRLSDEVAMRRHATNERSA